MKPAIKILLAFGLISGAVFVAAAQTNYPVVPVAVTADLSAARLPIPDDFLGLSFEISELLPDKNGNLWFSPDNQPLCKLLATMGVKNLRFGGNATDEARAVVPDFSGIDPMFELARTIDAKVIYTVRFSERGRFKGFSSADPQAAATTCRHILSKFPDRLEAFTIGNEADMYFKWLINETVTNSATMEKAEKFRRAYEAYRPEWERFAAVITASNPAVKLNGPDSAGYPDWAKWFAQDYAGDNRIAFISNHWYPGGPGQPGEIETKLKAMLSADWLNLYATNLAENVFLAPGHRPFRITECNSYFNGGAAGVSDTMAAALWSLDFGHWLAAHGCAGVNFHTSTRSMPSYGAFITNEQGYKLRAIGYGQTLLGMSCHGDSVSLTTAANEVNLTAYAVMGEDGNLYLTLINKEYDTTARAAAVEFTVKGGQIAGAGDSLALVAPHSHVRAKTGLTLGGAGVAEDGSWTGKWSRVSASALGAHGKFSVVVPPASALLVRLPLREIKDFGKAKVFGKIAAE